MKNVHQLILPSKSTEMSRSLCSDIYTPTNNNNGSLFCSNYLETMNHFMATY